MAQTTEVDTFDIFADAVRASFDAATRGKTHLFATSATDLFSVYLESFTDPVERQYHNCSCCRHFLNRYGNLVTIDETGATTSVMFGHMPSNLPSEYKKAWTDMALCVETATVTSVFASADKVWGIADGTDRAGPFHHFHVTPPASMVHTSPVKTAGQFKAETRQAFITLRRGLDFYNQNTFDTAVSLLMGGQNGFAKFLPQAQALAELKANPVAGRLWATIGTHGAQVGSIRSAAIGSLLDDIAAGKDADACRNRFLAVINPLSYQRPQAAPSAGNVAQAERIVDALGLRESFPRRYVGLADPVACSKASWWTPAEPTQKVAPVKPAKGMFASMLTPDELAKAQGKAAKMTWVRFRDTVLANARAIELVMPKAASFGALTTAVNPDAPPLFTWDKPDARNPYSWYRWMGATAQDFGFTEGAPVTVRCMMPVPSTWDGSKLHDGLILVLDGARDAQAAVAGTGLFPELLRPELFEVRRTVHAFSAKDILVDQGGPLFAGVVLRDSAPINLTLRVHTRTAAMDYTIDRWQ